MEHAYERQGALQSRAAGAVRWGSGMDRWEARTGIAPLGRLVKQGLAAAPSRSGAKRGELVTCFDHFDLLQTAYIERGLFASVTVSGCLCNIELQGSGT